MRFLTATLLIILQHKMVCASGGPSDEIIERVRTAWEDRRSAISTLQIEFQSLCLSRVPASELSPDEARSGETRRRPHHERNTVLISGEDVAIEVERDRNKVPWKPPRGRYVHTSAGSRRIHTDRGSTEFDGSSDGAVDSNMGNRYYGLYAVYLPIFLTYHGSVASNFEFDLSEASVVTGTHTIEGVECEVLRWEKERSSTLYSTDLWLDPARDYIPLRIQRRTNELPTVGYDCQFEPDPLAGYRLVAWQLTAVNMAGKLSHSENATVSTFRVNEAIPRERFQIEFPEGARVLVESTGERVTVAADGSIPGFSPPTGDRAVGLISWSVAAVVLVAAAVVLLRVCRRTDVSGR